jgi:hypothetical protein
LIRAQVSERLLFYSGRSSQMGEVHQGDTVMDYMQARFPLHAVSTRSCDC